MLSLAEVCNLKGLHLPDMETNRSPSWRLTQVHRSINSLLANAVAERSPEWIRPRDLPWRIHEVLNEFIAEDRLNGIAEASREQFDELSLMEIDQKVTKRNCELIDNMKVATLVSINDQM